MWELGLCYGLNCALHLPNPPVEAQTPSVTVFHYRPFKEVTKVKCSHKSGALFQ